MCRLDPGALGNQLEFQHAECVAAHQQALPLAVTQASAVAANATFAGFQQGPWPGEALPPVRARQQTFERVGCVQCDGLVQLDHLDLDDAQGAWQGGVIGQHSRRAPHPLQQADQAVAHRDRPHVGPDQHGRQAQLQRPFAARPGVLEQVLKGKVEHPACHGVDQRGRAEFTDLAQPEHDGAGVGRRAVAVRASGTQVDRAALGAAEQIEAQRTLELALQLGVDALDCTEQAAVEVVPHQQRVACVVQAGVDHPQLDRLLLAPRVVAGIQTQHIGDRIGGQAGRREEFEAQLGKRLGAARDRLLRRELLRMALLQQLEVAIERVGVVQQAAMGAVGVPGAFAGQPGVPRHRAIALHAHAQPQHWRPTCAAAQQLQAQRCEVVAGDVEHLRVATQGIEAGTQPGPHLSSLAQHRRFGRNNAGVSLANLVPVLGLEQVAEGLVCGVWQHRHQPWVACAKACQVCGRHAARGTGDLAGQRMLLHQQLQRRIRAAVGRAALQQTQAAGLEFFAQVATLVLQAEVVAPQRQPRDQPAHRMRQQVYRHVQALGLGQQQLEQVDQPAGGIGHRLAPVVGHGDDVELAPRLSQHPLVGHGHHPTGLQGACAGQRQVSQRPVED